MGWVDYYKILKVEKDVNETDLNRAYRTQAMKWHPDKNPNNKAESEARFKQVSEAYEVLSDPYKRALYDRAGPDGLKSKSKPNNKYPPSTSFRSAAAEAIFAEFFALQKLFARRKDPPIETRLPCSLEELYNGGTKKMKISRTVVDSAWKVTIVEEVLNVEIKPGWKKGTKITFEEKGNEEPDVVPADVVFVVDEKPHRLFTRDGDDLVAVKEISLADALTGCRVELTLLDGRTVGIPVDGVVDPKYEELVVGEGMPISKEPSKRGDLRIKFEIVFPKKLSKENKDVIRELLSDWEPLKEAVDDVAIA